MSDSVSQLPIVMLTTFSLKPQKSVKSEPKIHLRVMFPIVPSLLSFLLLFCLSWIFVVLDIKTVVFLDLIFLF